MSKGIQSAGDAAMATCGATATSFPAPEGFTPLRFLDPDPEAPAEVLDQVRRRAARVRLIAEGAEALFEQNRGCEIDLRDVLDLFGQIFESAWEIEQAAGKAARAFAAANQGRGQ